MAEWRSPSDSVSRTTEAHGAGGGGGSSNGRPYSTLITKWNPPTCKETLKVAHGRQVAVEAAVFGSHTQA
ncbi:unnamed protein product [Staurois parvus]|uniref:Uncharacterized protein n=1 Tax=Staurois parvus TaxID=386267 RepID=A0ABN9H549_9NEOB|nr:unnamed protein product [Staurois parvus]